MTFDDLRLIKPLLRAVRAENYTQPTPVQVEAIPHVLDGKDLLGCAQTGTGKTAAFALPILQRLVAGETSGQGARPVRCLVLSPTRELARQIGESFRVYGKYVPLRSTVVYGGVKQGPQTRALNNGVDILVATPGRLLDLMGQGFVKLSRVEVFVLDEADRMLDMGFIDDIRRIVARLPRHRQTLFFSATMPPKIQSLADSILRDPVEVRVTPQSLAAETVHHSVFFVERLHKQALLQHLLEDPDISRALVFTRTKYGAERLSRQLKRSDIRADTIHSDKSQMARQRALEKFKCGATRVLVASDVAARGIDVDNISHVINFDLPHEPELYVHRIGRTGRAGAPGQALSFCGVEERCQLDDIEKLIRKPLETVEAHPFCSPLPRANVKRGKKATGFRSRHRRPGRKRRL